MSNKIAGQAGSRILDTRMGCRPCQSVDLGVLRGWGGCTLWLATEAQRREEANAEKLWGAEPRGKFGLRVIKKTEDSV